MKVVLKFNKQKAWKESADRFPKDNIHVLDRQGTNIGEKIQSSIGKAG